MKQLEKGDIIYRKHYGKITHRIEIERVTKTLAVSNSWIFKREYHDSGYVHEKQNERFSSASYYIETQELKEEWKKEQMALRLEKTNFRELDIKKLSQLCTLL